MSRKLASLCAALSLCAMLALAPMAALADETGAPVTVKVNMARILKISAPAATVIIGNPGVADVTIQDPTTLVLTGKSYGQTNMIVLDAKGNPVADTIVEVVESEANLVTVFSAGERSTIACAPSCNPAVMVGDAPAYTQQLTGSMGLVQSAAQ